MHGAVEGASPTSDAKILTKVLLKVEEFVEDAIAEPLIDLAPRIMAISVS
jgi:hypothetical protein